MDARAGKRVPGALLERVATRREDSKEAIEPTIGPSRLGVLQTNDRRGGECDTSRASAKPTRIYTSTHHINSDITKDTQSQLNINIQPAISTEHIPYIHNKNKRSMLSEAVGSTGRTVKRSKHTTSNGQPASGGSKDMRGVAKALANTQTEEPYGVREAGPNAALDKGTRSNGDSNQPSSKRTVHTGSSQRPPRTHEERHKSKPILLKRPPAKPEKGKMNIDMRSGSEEEIKEAQLVVPTAPLTDKLADTCTRIGTPEIMAVYAHASDKERPATSAPGVGRKRTAENVNPHLYSPRVEQQAAAHNHQPELVDGRAWLNASINPSSCPADAHAHARDTEIDDGHHASSQPDIAVSTAKPAATAIEADRAGAPASEYDTMTDVQSVKAFISILRNREPCNAGTSTGTQATVKAGRMALARLLNTPILDLRDFASDCLEIVESIQFATPRQIEFKRPIGDKHLLQAISLAVNVVRATPSTIDSNPNWSLGSP